MFVAADRKSSTENEWITSLYVSNSNYSISEWAINKKEKKEKNSKNISYRWKRENK